MRIPFFTCAAALALCSQAALAEDWRFAVSGDSRNCGDVVMPAIAHSAQEAKARFYWHLGDFRAMYVEDEDLASISKPMQLPAYQTVAWDDFVAHQLAPFGNLPVFLAIGNHELVAPKTRNDYVAQFADWLDATVLRKQRLHDDASDHRVKPYYHWIEDGIDFITLDNASPDQFDDAQLKWIEALIARDSGDALVRAMVVGMHEALPDSLASSHSMNASPVGTVSGRRVYAGLVQFHKGSHKPVYVLASHSHFYMADVFNTEARRASGDVLPGWIVGTAGAVRYTLPPVTTGASAAKEHVYGYLLATVRGAAIQFEFKEFKTEEELRAATDAKFGAGIIHNCFVNNPPPKP